MLNVRWLASGGNKEFHHVPSPSTGLPTLVILTPAQAHGQFKSSTRTTAGTTIIVEPRPGLSLAVTDILLSGEKQPNSDLTIQFTDGTNTVIIFVSNQVDVPPSVDANLTSYFYGWTDARIEMITSGTGDATVTIGYIHTQRDLTFSEWDALR